MMQYIIRKVSGEKVEESFEEKVVKLANFTQDGKIEVNELNLNVKPLKVITIIGKARTGKSSFLNCIISKIYERDMEVFETNGLDEHCTHGIDAYLVENDDEQLLLLDAQGIEYQDSSIDSKLLLFVYLLSDIVIFNEKGMLSNATLNSLQPLATFVNCLELSDINKPKIIFKISDVDLEINPNKNLEKTLIHRDDQYQNIRESLMNLFSELNAYKTECLDRSEKQLLKNKKYYSFIQNEENGFNEIIEKLLNIGCNKYNGENYNMIVKGISEMINTNQKIDWNKLDITKQIAKSEIIEWMQENINPGNYLGVIVDGSQEDYDKKIKPLIEYLEIILDLFDKRFNKSPPQIRDIYRTDIYNKLLYPIEDGILQTNKKADEKLNSILETKMYNLTNNKEFEDLVSLEGYLLKIQELINLKESKLYKPCVDTAIEKLEKIIGGYLEQKEKYLTKEKEEKSCYENKVKKEYEKHKEKMYSNLCAYLAELLVSFDEIPLKSIINKKLKEITYISYSYIIVENKINIKHEESKYNEKLIMKLIESYEINIYKERFITERNKYLTKYLVNYQTVDNLRLFDNYNKLKKNNKVELLYQRDWNEGENVEIISRFYDIKKILTSDEFNSYYPKKVVEYYYKMENKDEKIKKLIADKIIDILIEDIIENKI